MASEEAGREAAIKGFANEHFVVAILMERYGNVSLVDLPLSPYDIIIVRKTKDGYEDIIRVQVKTVDKKGQIKFFGGTRGGKDRKYVSDVKKYFYDTKVADVVVGVARKGEKLDLYFIPTYMIERCFEKQSINVSKIEWLRENYQMLERCKDYSYMEEECEKHFKKHSKHP